MRNLGVTLLTFGIILGAITANPQARADFVNVSDVVQKLQLIHEDLCRIEKRLPGFFKR